MNSPHPLLLVVCTGNVCRSPMAEALVAHYVASEGGEATIVSRGLAAPVGRAPHAHAIEVARKNGVPIDASKRAALITSAEVSMATIILVMDGGHRQDIQQRFPTATGKTFLLGQWQSQEIADPINLPFSAFMAAWEKIDEGAKSWVQRLKEAGMLKSPHVA